MRIVRVTLIVVLLFLVLLGASMAFDARFIPLSSLTNNPLFVGIIYGPTVIFALIAVAQLFRHRIWPAAAFSIGLVGTGLCHQWIAEKSYGNPGYMVPIGHMVAPVVSMVFYLASFLAVWVIVKFLRLRIRRLSKEDYDRAQAVPKDNGAA